LVICPDGSFEIWIWAMDLLKIILIGDYEIKTEKDYRG
jgi:hypothetical protein